MSTPESRSTTTDAQGQSIRWRPRTPRLASLMSLAREQAELDVDCQDLFKSLSPDVPRPSKAITKRQKASKRCAEVFRSKFQFYTVLLERELSEEMNYIQSTKEETRLLAQKNEEMLQRIKIIQDLKMKSGVSGSQESDPFSSSQNTEHLELEQNVLDTDGISSFSGHSSLQEVGGEYFFEESLNSDCLVAINTGILDNELMPGSPISLHFLDGIF